MRHYGHISDERLPGLFRCTPASFSKQTPRDMLMYALGAMLYMPATRERAHEMIIGRKFPSLTSLALCMEDAVAGSMRAEALRNTLAVFAGLDAALSSGRMDAGHMPLVFVRVADLDQMDALLGDRAAREHAAGFILPKFDTARGGEYLDRIERANRECASPIYALPILESRAVMSLSTRARELFGIRELLDAHRHIILNVRVGGTDFSGLYGLRRKPGQTIYDLAVVNGCLADVINIFLEGGDNYVLSGPVWEYFPQPGRPSGPEAEGLARELCMDAANGFVGKTVIHPSQVAVVNARQAVPAEDYADAGQVLGMDGGVCKSASANKMNETSPHRLWATKVMKRAAVYGVLAEGRTAEDLV